MSLEKIMRAVFGLQRCHKILRKRIVPILPNSMKNFIADAHGLKMCLDLEQDSDFIE